MLITTSLLFVNPPPQESTYVLLHHQPVEIRFFLVSSEINTNRFQMVHKLNQ